MPEGLRAVLVGEAEGVKTEDNRFSFDEVYPGDHTLYVYGNRGDIRISKFTTDYACAHIELEFMIDLCIGTELTPVRGTVTGDKGKPVGKAAVAVADLFIETVTDKKGGYELILPPGEWTISATDAGETAKKDITIETPEVDREVPPITVDLRFD